MSPEWIGAIGILVMTVLMFSRMPIAFTMALVGFIGFTYLTSLNGSLFLLSNGFFFQFTSYTMLVVPLFVLMGEICFHAGISKKLYDTAYAWLGFIPGGLAVATVGACAGFAAICGSSAATAATMGTVALPEMKKFNYDKSFATGTVAAGGTLGILIPPSIVLIVYGMQVELSIGKLFIAGILPGLVLSALFIGCILMMCLARPGLGPAALKTTFKQKIKSLSGTIETLLLFFFVIGGLVIGWFTPTEAAGMGAAGAIFIGVLTKNLNWEKFKKALLGTTRTSAMVLLIIACAMIFSRFLTVSRLPQALAQWVDELHASPYLVLTCVMIIYVLGGCFMDALSFMIITIHIFYPMIVAAGFDPIWFGVIIVILLETGAVTPPVGINVYVIKGIAPEVELYTIFRGIAPFLMMMFICLVILTIFPEIALVLPNLMK
jgi:C4-dicarboxylate transporter DctM subunit